MKTLTKSILQGDADPIIEPYRAAKAPRVPKPMVETWTQRFRKTVKEVVKDLAANIAIGYRAGLNNTTSTANTAIGVHAIKGQDPWSTLIGHMEMFPKWLADAVQTAKDGFSRFTAYWDPDTKIPSEPTKPLVERRMMKYFVFVIEQPPKTMIEVGRLINSMAKRLVRDFEKKSGHPIEKVVAVRELALQNSPYDFSRQIRGLIECVVWAEPEVYYD